MKIALLTHYFWPELGAPSARLLEMGREWAAWGHEVTVVTNFPNHPDYPAIQSLIRNCRSLATIFHLLNNFDDFSAIMVDLSYTDELLKSLYTWKGKPKNLRIGLKYFNVLINFLRDEDLRVPGVTWTSQF